MERKYYFDKELHVLRAGHAQFFAKFTVFYVLYNKKPEFFSGFVRGPLWGGHALIVCYHKSRKNTILQLYILLKIVIFVHNCAQPALRAWCKSLSGRNSLSIAILYDVLALKYHKIVFFKKSGLGSPKVYINVLYKDIITGSAHVT